MKPLRTRLLEARKKLGLPWEVLERDYLLSWILAGIAQVDALRDALVFKGGTALRKCYFGEYRFSEDLDFSAMACAPSGDTLTEAIAEVCFTASKLLDEYAPVEISSTRYTERDAHPRGQEAFTIKGRLPWQREATTRIMIEITMDEPVLRPVAMKRILHAYGEPIQAVIPVYALEEIVAEKLRTILQHLQKLEERGWSRSCARDYYDLWQLLEIYPQLLNLSDFEALLREKCAVRSVTFTTPEDFFPRLMLDHVQQTWEQWLGPLVTDLPPFADLIEDLRPRVAALVS